MKTVQNIMLGIMKTLPTDLIEGYNYSEGGIGIITLNEGTKIIINMLEAEFSIRVVNETGVIANVVITGDSDADIDTGIQNLFNVLVEAEYLEPVVEVDTDTDDDENGDVRVPTADGASTREFFESALDWMDSEEYRNAQVLTDLRKSFEIMLNTIYDFCDNQTDWNPELCEYENRYVQYMFESYCLSSFFTGSLYFEIMKHMEGDK